MNTYEKVAVIYQTNCYKFLSLSNTCIYGCDVYGSMFCHFYTGNLCFFNSPLESNCAKTFITSIGQKGVYRVSWKILVYKQTMARVVIYKRNHIYTRFNLCSTASHLNLSRLMTKPTKWSVRPAKPQISLGIRPVWSESSRSAWRSTGSLATHWAHSEDSDQTGCPDWSESLLGAHIILLVLSWGGSFIYFNFSLLLYQTFD